MTFPGKTLSTRALLPRADLLGLKNSLPENGTLVRHITAGAAAYAFTAQLDTAVTTFADSSEFSPLDLSAIGNTTDALAARYAQFADNAPSSVYIDGKMHFHSSSIPLISLAKNITPSFLPGFLGSVAERIAESAASAFYVNDRASIYNIGSERKPNPKSHHADITYDFSTYRGQATARKRQHWNSRRTDTRTRKRTSIPDPDPDGIKQIPDHKLWMHLMTVAEEYESCRRLAFQMYRLDWSKVVYEAAERIINGRSTVDSVSFDKILAMGNGMVDGEEVSLAADMNLDNFFRQLETHTRGFAILEEIAAYQKIPLQKLIQADIMWSQDELTRNKDLPRLATNLARLGNESVVRLIARWALTRPRAQGILYRMARHGVKKAQEYLRRL